MPENEKDSENRVRKLATDIINELLKRGEPMSVDIKARRSEACGAKFYSCTDYNCEKAFVCQSTSGFECWGRFKDSTDYTLSLG